MTSKLSRHLITIDDSFVFIMDEEAQQSHNSRVMQNGVVLHTMRDSNFLASIEFDKSKFTFDEARDFIREEFFMEVSDEQDAEASIKFSDNGMQHVLMSMEMKQEQLQATEMSLHGGTMLACTCVAITAGTWNDLTFSEQVIHDAIPLMQAGVPMVEEHNTSSIGNVIGAVQSTEAIPGGAASSFVIFNPASIKKIKTGVKNSVSVHFLAAIKDGVVERVGSMVELTLCKNPACKDAQILAMTDVEMPLATAEMATVTIDGTELEISSRNAAALAYYSKSNQMEKSMSENEDAKLAQQNEELTAKVAALEAEKAEEATKLSATQTEITSLQTALNNSRAEERVRLAKDASAKLVEEAKLAPAAQELFQSLYLELAAYDEDRKPDAQLTDAVAALFRAGPDVVPQGQSGQIVEDRPPNDPVELSNEDKVTAVADAMLSQARSD